MDNEPKPAMKPTTIPTRKDLEAQRRRDSKWAQHKVDTVLSNAFKDAAWTWDLIRELGLA
jgi:hypothetical protein